MTNMDDALDDALSSFGSSDLIPHSKLIQIARNAWNRMPASDRGSAQAVERWRAAIYMACKPSLEAASASMRERAGEDDEDSSHIATKLALLKEAFTNQVDRAMRDLSDGDRARREQVRAMESVNDMIKGMR